MRTSQWLVPGLAALCTACASVRLPVLRTLEPATATPATLQVPYVSQSVLLCGGAAIAMIERWWGRRGVFAEDFAHLVRQDEGGIRTTDLASTMAARGWATQALSATPAMVQRSLADSVPVIVLLQVSKRRYHYVVVLAWRAGAVTYHDPAVSPAITVDSAKFMTRWIGARQWALFARPATTATEAIAAPAVITPAPMSAADSLPCRPWLDRAADAAAQNRLDDAAGLLATASTSCPSEPLVLREMAGVRFRQGRTADALRIATDYVQRVPADSLGWQLLASSRYLTGDTRGALAAWNVVGRPIVDLVQIDGTRRTRFTELLAAVDVAPGEALTPARLALAQRRLADIPSLGRTRLDYAAVSGGVVEVRGTVQERPRADAVPALLAGVAIDAAVRRDVSLSLFSPLGHGEQWTAQWRWQPADPRVALRLAIPTRIGVPAVFRVEQSWEQYRFSAAEPGERRTVSWANISAWMRPEFELLAGARIEQWSDRGAFVALMAGVGLHDVNDRVALLAEGEHAFSRSEARSYDRLRARAAWAPSRDRWKNLWSFRIGTEWSSAGTPRGLQPIAGGDLARDIPLRAHRFILDSRLPSARIARAIAHGGVAADRHLTRKGAISLGAGLFVDGAHLISGRNTPADPRLYLDAGAGVQIGLTGSKWAALRIDVARGLAADRRWGVIAGLAPAWPIRLGRHRQ